MIMKLKIKKSIIGFTMLILGGMVITTANSCTSDKKMLMNLA